MNTTVNLTWLCLPLCMTAYLGIIFLIARSRFRSGLLYSQKLRNAQAKGAFDDMNQPQVKTKMRWLALLALSGLFSMIVILFLVILLVLKVISFQGQMGIIVLAAFIIFGTLAILSSAAGAFMKHEIDRRL